MMSKTLTTTTLLLTLALLISACAVQGVTPSTGAPEQAAASAPAEEAQASSSQEEGFGSTLATIQERGHLVCGVNAQLPGFGYVDSEGNYAGFDVDFCKALAAAIFGDTDSVEYRPLTATERFTALQTGEIDILIRNTTWTLSRDTDLGGNFSPTTFFDGQGMMVRRDSEITRLEDMQGTFVCVQAGTTTELNLADQMAARGVEYSPVVFETTDQTFAAYEEGRCDGVTSDKSQLVARQTVLSEPDQHTILDVTMSKEPLGPMVRHGDDQWYDVVKWSVYVTFEAEEAGVTSANVDEIRGSTENPNIMKLLGLEGDFGAKLGLSNDWSYNIIKLVGNYGEIYDRNLGPGTPYNLPRGFNALYTDGGLLYAMPIR
jgi:general L-amino acid transport system substrate-binding protein